MSGETDQVRWRGVQPVDGIRGIWPERNATRVNEVGVCTGIALVIIYTVPAGKKLFVASGFIVSAFSGIASARSWVYIRDDQDANLFPLMYNMYKAPGTQFVPMHYSPAVEAEAGYDVFIENTHANLDSRGAIFGWLEDA